MNAPLLQRCHCGLTTGTCSCANPGTKPPPRAPGALPWQTRVVDEISQGGKVYKQLEVRDAHGGPVASIYYVTPEGEEHATRIVKSVNAHDEDRDLIAMQRTLIERLETRNKELVAALRAADRALQALDVDTTYNMPAELRALIDAVLAKAAAPAGHVDCGECPRISTGCEAGKCLKATGSKP